MRRRGFISALDSAAAAWISQQSAVAQAALAAKDQGRSAREGGLVSKMEYEKYLTDVTKGDE
jgi:hypothetical protein